MDKEKSNKCGQLSDLRLELKCKRQNVGRLASSCSPFLSQIEFFFLIKKKNAATYVVLNQVGGRRRGWKGNVL